jgi:hypothetical protein
MLPTGDEMNQFSPSFPMMLLSVIEEENVVGRSDVARFTLAAAAGLRPGQYHAGSVVKPDH